MAEYAPTSLLEMYNSLPRISKFDYLTKVLGFSREEAEEILNRKTNHDEET